MFVICTADDFSKLQFKVPTSDTNSSLLSLITIHSFVCLLVSHQQQQQQRANMKFPATSHSRQLQTQKVDQWQHGLFEGYTQTNTETLKFAYRSVPQCGCSSGSHPPTAALIIPWRLVYHLLIELKYSKKWIENWIENWKLKIENWKLKIEKIKSNLI